MYKFQTRLIRLKHKIAAHSMTDSGPIFDAYHFYHLGSELLKNRFGYIMRELGKDYNANYTITMPTIYYKSSNVFKGQDDDIIDGQIVLVAENTAFPSLEFKINISNKKMEIPKHVKHGGEKYDFDSEGMKKFFRKVNPKFYINMDNRDKSMLGGMNTPSAFYGDQSKTRADLLAPIETGDEQMLGRSTGPYVGV